MSRGKSLKQDIKTHILYTSARLFAEKGLAAVSVRDITGEARVNISSLNYYFGSKEHLIREVFETLLRPLQSERIALLDQIEQQAGDGGPDLESVLRAMIEPTIRSAVREDDLSTYLPRLMFQAFSFARSSIGEEVGEENDRVTMRFINALARAAPDIPYEDICWRYYLILGGFALLCTDARGAQRLRRLSDGLCDTDDADRIIEEMIAFFLPGMTGPAPSKPSKPRQSPRPS